MAQSHTTDVLIVGGGLAGLTAATFLARAGRSVKLFEKASSLGGRAATQTKNDFHFNLGPHALYRASHAKKILDELGIAFSGNMPNASGGFAIAQGKKHTLPGGFVSLLTTSLLRLPAKFELAHYLGSLPSLDTKPLQHTSVADWLSTAIRHPEVCQLFQALFRLTSYTNDPERQSAGAALEQLQLALAANVTYIDGGWQTLVDGLHTAAQAAGVQLEVGKRIVAIEPESEPGKNGHHIRLGDGTEYTATAVIIAASPSVAAGLVHNEAAPLLQQWADGAIPVTAACLDVALSSLPQPRARFALGIDQPLYFSVHSDAAKLAPEGGAVIHVAKYVPPESSQAPETTEHECEQLLELLQPGWRDVLVERRFLPNMIVTNAQVTATAGGLAGRPGPAVPNIPNLYIVGDWVGPAGMLVDGSFASAKQAADMILSAQQAYPVAA